MAPKNQDAISPSRFRALSFRNPFSTSHSTEKPKRPSPCLIPAPRASEAASPVSNSTATTSSAVSTIDSVGTSAATSPDSEDCPDTKQHVGLPCTTTAKRLPITILPRKSSIDANDVDSIASFCISPLGTARKDSFLESFKGAGVAVDGGADSLQRNLSTSQDSKPPPIRLSGSPLTTSRPTSLVGSFQSGKSDQSIKSIRSFGSSLGDDGDWDFDSLLDMTNEVRVALNTKGIVPTSNIEELSLLLDALLRDELSPRPSTEIDLVIQTRFDQLLKEILGSSKTMCIDRDQEAIFIKSRSLKRKWERRFKGVYFNIQKPRMEQMKTNGALRGLTLVTKEGGHAQTWNVAYAQPADLEGNLNFTPGDWWLNIHGALRDGAVGLADKMLTIGITGVVALALLAGEEISGPTLNLFEYTRISQGTDESMKLMACNRGQPIRVLRGSNLKSKYAPKAGIRYDGLYVVRQFGHKLLDENKDIYRCTIMLERVTNQRPLHEVLQLPKPSQLDDWDLYKKMMNEDFRLREGDVAFGKLRELEEEQLTDKEQFIKSKALQEGIRKYTVVARKPSYLHD
ncbi:hypothetical protein BKA65DRAFT_540825 [Rhexocercosporidium sp. MPI-PUGE-AT-0058]|nr:hypothetical protein BKA65DRAFT_540825 [Rhexocercosporidium sp. MPI-PUGE-AT-0058]